MRLAFHEDALEEYKHAARYYAGRSPQLGLRFVEAVESAIRRILEAPAAGRVIDDDIRRCLTNVFPYGVLYTIESDQVLVVAVMHCSRAPDYWKRRLQR